MISYGIVVHGGVGSSRELDDGCEAAAAKGRAVLARGGSALDAVVEAAVALEDDGRFNAGSGSCLRLDGKTIEMDASVMTSAGELGAVAAIQRVKNPVLVAREVMKTPHVLLCADGALAFARRCGFADHYRPSPNAKTRYEEVRRAMAAGETGGLRSAWRTFDLKSKWNFAAPYEAVFGARPRPARKAKTGCDTIGAVAVDRKGLLAAANSTGGAAPMLAGRIGDSPIVGCGFYAGPSASIVTTGIGEEIIRKLLARQVHDWISAGEDVARACERGVALYAKDVPIGVIAIARRGAASAANRDMAHSVQVVE